MAEFLNLEFKPCGTLGAISMRKDTRPIDRAAWPNHSPSLVQTPITCPFFASCQFRGVDGTWDGGDIFLFFELLFFFFGFSLFYVFLFVIRIVIPTASAVVISGDIRSPILIPPSSSAMGGASSPVQATTPSTCIVGTRNMVHKFNVGTNPAKPKSGRWRKEGTHKYTYTTIINPE